MFGFFAGAKAAMDVKKATALQAEFDAFWKHVESLNPANKTAVAEGALAIIEAFRKRRITLDEHWTHKAFSAAAFLREGEIIIRQAHSNMYSSDPNKVAIGYSQAVAGYYIKAQGLHVHAPKLDTSLEFAALQKGYTPPALAYAQITDTIGSFVSESVGKEIKKFEY